MSNNKSLEDFYCVSDKQLFTELNAYEDSQIAGGQFTVVLEEIGQIPLPEAQIRTQTTGPNPTAIQILNETSLTLNYGLVYDTFRDNTIEPGATQTFFGQQPRAAAGWDNNLARSDIQLDLELLKPEFQYAFRIV